MRHPTCPPSRRTQHGMGLIEVMVAMAIALFLLGGLYSILESNQRAYRDHSQLTQLADSERFALTVLTEVIEQAGYFPDPTKELAATEFPADALFPSAGSAIVGTAASLSVRFVTASDDGLLNCSGTENTSGAEVDYENTFSLDPQGELVCSLNGAAAEPLVSGVKSFTVEYGVKTNGESDTSFDTYKNAAQMGTSDWANVVCIKVTVTFVNPLAASPGQPQTIPVSRVVTLMSRAGTST